MSAACASSELKHGPIALVDEHVPVIVRAPYDELFDKIVSNMQEVMARGGKVLLISDTTCARIAGKVITLPAHAQPFACHIAVTQGTEVDQPRNLAKSVAVEEPRVVFSK